MFEQLSIFFTIEMIYMWLNIGVVPLWFILLFFPQSKFCSYLITSIFPYLIFALIYIYLFYYFLISDYDVLNNFNLYTGLSNFEDHEIEALIRTNNNSWERSTDTGSTNEFGETGRILSSGRTSANSWCRHECESHPDVSNVMAKIEEVTNIPRTHYESFQVLKYDVGQYYRTHHDYGGDDRRLPCGPRILTFFVYLSDVDEGGETGFPTLGINVQPKKGRALLWPSTISEDPSRREPRTMHEAKTVLKGRKYAANSWIHLYDYAKPNLWGCTGTFDELTHD